MLAQNHRGHQSHGFTTYDGGLEYHLEIGLIPPIFETGIKSRIRALKGSKGIANVRYTTSGSSDSGGLHRDAMPIVVSEGKKSLAISLNGNVVNVRQLQKIVEVNKMSSDAHALSRLILQELREEGSVEEAARNCMEAVDGSFSITCLDSEGRLFAFRDSHGIKPLCYGRTGAIQAFSSESVGLDINNITLEREVRPGEVMQIEELGVKQERVAPCGRKAFCAFEFAYFARPDSRFNGTYVYLARQEYGVNLAEASPGLTSSCDAVLSLPETANDAAYGFHKVSGLPWEMATRRHRYVTQRAFITGGHERGNVIEKKMNILGSRVNGKKLAVVDDSIVRGDTTRSVISRLKAAGAKEIHMFITFPRITGPCFYGIDMATYSELIGARQGPEEIAEEIGADSVNYQPIRNYIKATGMSREELCLGCVNGEYPTPLANKMAREMRERLENGEPERGRIYEYIEI
ncbi:MAG: amidophosphoribosyltransferase [Candidatus Bathyarchaeota archaeon]|jgi:amidophosphoribosyltransferase